MFATTEQDRLADIIQARRLIRTGDGASCDPGLDLAFFAADAALSASPAVSAEITGRHIAAVAAAAQRDPRVTDADAHASVTDADARLYRKGRGQKAALCYIGHLLTENRHGMVVGMELTAANGRGGASDGGTQHRRARHAGGRPRLRRAWLRDGAALASDRFFSSLLVSRVVIATSNGVRQANWCLGRRCKSSTAKEQATPRSSASRARLVARRAVKRRQRGRWAELLSTEKMHSLECRGFPIGRRQHRRRRFWRAVVGLCGVKELTHACTSSTGTCGRARLCPCVLPRRDRNGKGVSVIR